MVEKVTVVQNVETKQEYFLISECQYTKLKDPTWNGGYLEVTPSVYVLKDVNNGEIEVVDSAYFNRKFKVTFTNDQQYSHL